MRASNKLKEVYNLKRLGLPVIYQDQSGDLVMEDEFNAHDLQHYDTYISHSLNEFKVDETNTKR